MVYSQGDHLGGGNVLFWKAIIKCVHLTSFLCGKTGDLKIITYLPCPGGFCRPNFGSGEDGKLT